MNAAPPPPRLPAIRVRHLWHRFGQFDVLRDVSFEVQPGEIFGFIGPNGAGKTTAIRILATLLEPLAGRVEVDGHDVTLDPEQVRRIIGYMPDHAGVYDRVTVREYLEFFADAYRVPSAGTTYAVVDAVMELTDLSKLATRLVATMSKGMKQRLQLARTLLHDPKVLILDEPASDLDPRARIEIRDLLLELQRMGKTIFLSSHILTELADLCSSVAILERGQLIVSGPIHDIARKLELHTRQTESVTAPSPDATSTATPAHSPAPVLQSRNARIRVLAPSASVAMALAGAPEVVRVTPAPGGLAIVQYRGEDAGLAEVVRLLVMAGIPVAGVEPERNELERVFLEATRGEVQ